MKKHLLNYIRNTRFKITKWYIDNGYTFEVGSYKNFYDCPWWVKPLLIFFSKKQYVDIEIERSNRIINSDHTMPLSELFANLIYEHSQTDPRTCPDCGSEATVWSHTNQELGLTTNYCGCEKCGYCRFSSCDEKEAVTRWNGFVDRYVHAMAEKIF